LNYKVYEGTTLKTTVSSKTVTITGLMPYTSYTFGIIPNNGLRNGTRKEITVKTRGLRFIIPTILTVGGLITLRFQTYSLGLVPIGTEPSGTFGGGKKKTVDAKVISSNGGSSIIELISTDSSFTDGTQFKRLEDGSFGAFNGINALYYR
jgi:hypothetical protein